MIFENRKLFYIFFVIVYIVSILFALSGSMYFVFSYKDSYEIGKHLEEYKSSIRMGMNMWGIFKTGCIKYLILTLIIVVSSFFKYGFMASLFMVARNAFTDSFTISAISHYFGLKAYPMLISYIPSAVIIIPILALFVAISAVLSLDGMKKDKKRVLIYIIFSIMIFTIFCICLFFESLITTTFANLLLNKVT